VWYKFSKTKRDDYLKNLGVAEDIINYLNSLPDKEANPMLASINKNPNITLEELIQLHPKKEKSVLQDKLNAAKQIIKNYYLTRLGYNEIFVYWLEAQLLKTFRKNPIFLQTFLSELLNYQKDYREIYDFYRAIKQENPRFDINSFSLEQIEQMSHDWHEAVAQKGSGNVYLPTKPENIIHKFNNGWKLVTVDNENDLNVEGNLMNHCVGSYAHQVENSYVKILSLRDPSNKPHVTIEISPDLSEIYQIKGKNNSEPKDEYKKLLKEYFEHTHTFFQEETTIDEKIDELKFGRDKDYDDGLNAILNSKANKKQRDDYGLLIKEPMYELYEYGFSNILDIVSRYVTSRSFDKYYQDDVAITLVDYASKQDIEYLKDFAEKNESIPLKIWMNSSLIAELMVNVNDVFDKFHENWYYDPYTPYPQNEDYESQEDYEEAIEQYEKECQQEEEYAYKDYIRNDRELNFWNEILEQVNKEREDPEYKNLVERVVVPDQPNPEETTQITQAFNLKKYLQKQAMIKLANEYWFHDNQTEFADGDIGDKNHEMIAEEYIINHFIPNIPEHLYDLGLSTDVLNDYAPNDLDFIQYLMEKYNYEEDDAIDNAYYGNYIRWLVTGNDEAESPIIQELLHALKDPRKYAVEKLGWIRVRGRNIETYNLDQEHLNEIVSGLQEIFGDNVYNMQFNIETYSPRKYYENIPFYEIEDGSIRKRFKSIISDEPNVKPRTLLPGHFPGYKYPGG